MLNISTGQTQNGSNLSKPSMESYMHLPGLSKDADVLELRKLPHAFAVVQNCRDCLPTQFLKTNCIPDSCLVKKSDRKTTSRLDVK